MKIYATELRRNLGDLVYEYPRITYFTPALRKMVYDSKFQTAAVFKGNTVLGHLRAMMGETSFSYAKKEQ